MIAAAGRFTMVLLFSIEVMRPALAEEIDSHSREIESARVPNEVHSTPERPSIRVTLNGAGVGTGSRSILYGFVEGMTFPVLSLKLNDLHAPFLHVVDLLEAGPNPLGAGRRLLHNMEPY